ncbi:MAG: carboxypeptidase-like regulatory domain-containing protein [Gemmatimonadaceae bacterium]
MIAHTAARLAAGAMLAAVAGCANQSAPPGGPPDPVPPTVTGISPDSGAVGVRPRTVDFQFDEVVAERPTRATSLAQAVLVSPYQGEPDVRWHRDRISVRLPGGWRDSTVYVVTLLPGTADLRNNILDSAATTVFSTGGPIPATTIAGVVFDWAAGTPSRNALVQALVPRGRDTTRYVARSDSSGRFTLPFVPAGTLLVRGILDENSNYAVDRLEGWDTTRVTLRDSAFVELYTFVRDTIGPAVREVTVTDSVTLRLELTRPLALDQRLDTALVTLLTSDSARVPLSAVLTAAAADSLAATARAAAERAAADSARRADTTAVPAPPAAPPIAAPPAAPPRADSVRADSVQRLPPPVPSRPIPPSSIVVRTAVPLTPETRYNLRLNGARGLDGPARTSERSFLTAAADTASRTPPDSAATPDSVPPDSIPPAPLVPAVAEPVTVPHSAPSSSAAVRAPMPAQRPSATSLPRASRPL